MDHKTLIAGIPAGARETLTRKSDRAGLRHLAGHLGAIFVTGMALSLGAPFWPIWAVSHGILLVFLFTLLHETSHKTPFASARLNTWVGHLCGFLLLIPANWFRFFHFAHHRHTQIPGKDPELDSPKPETAPQYLVHISGGHVWRGNILTLWTSAFGTPDYPYLPEARRGEITREARIYLALYALVLLFSLAWQSWAAVTLWLLPMLLGQPFLRLYLLAEHGRCKLVANMLENTRTTFTNRLVRALAWNMPYHAEHHSFPNVPFHQLPALHDWTRAHLGVTERGYARFNARYISAVPGRKTHG